MNSHGQLYDRKRSRDENLKSPPSPEQHSKSHKKKKKHKGSLNPQEPSFSAEANAVPNETPQVCPNANQVTPVVATPIPISVENEQRAEPNEATAEHPESESASRKKKSKRKKKDVAAVSNLQEVPFHALQVESEQKSANDEGAEPEVSIAQPQLCPNPVTSVVATQISNSTEKERGAELIDATAEHPVPESTPQKKKSKRKEEKDVAVSNVQELQVESEQKIVNDKGAGPSEVSIVQPQVHPNPVTPVVATPISISAEKEQGAEQNDATAEHPVAESTPWRKKSKRKKEKDVVLNDVQEESFNALQVELEQKSANEEGAGRGEVSTVQPQICPNPVTLVAATAIPIFAEKDQGAEPNDATVEHPVAESTPRKKKSKRKKEKDVVLSEVQEEPFNTLRVELEQKSANEEGAGLGEVSTVQPQICPNPVIPVVATAISISVEKEQGAELNDDIGEHPVAESTHWKNKLKRKKEKDVVVSHVQEEPFNALEVEPEQKSANEEGAGLGEVSTVQPQICPNPVIPVVATSIPISEEKEQGAEMNGATVGNPVSESTPRKKKSKKKKKEKDETVINVQEQPFSALQVESEQRNAMEEGPGPGEVGTLVEAATPVVKGEKKCVELKETSAEQPQVCSKADLASMVAGKNEGAAEHPEIVPVPDSAPLQGTPHKRKWEKEKKEVVNGQEEEPKGSSAEELQLCNSVNPTILIGAELKIVKEIGGGTDFVNAECASVCSKLEYAIPISLEKKEGAESNESGPKHALAIQVDAEKKEGAGPNEALSKHSELLFPVPNPTLPKDTPQFKPLETEPMELDNPEHPQVCSKPNSAPPTDSQHVIVSSKNRRKRKRNSEVAEPNKQNDQPPQIPVQRSISLETASKTGQTILTDHGKPPEIPVQGSICPIAASQTIPIDQKLSIDPEQTTGKKKRQRRGKKGKNALKSKESEFDKHSAESTAKIPVQRSICPIAASQTSLTIPIDHVKPPDFPVQVSICPIAASQTGQTIQMDHVKQPEIPVQVSLCHVAASQTGQTIPIDHVKPPETPVQGSICPIVASHTYQVIPKDQTLSIDPATPVDPEQTSGKKKRRRRGKKGKSALKSKESESDKHNAEPTAKIPVQRSMCPIAASQTDQTILIDQKLPRDPATPVDPEQTSGKKKRRRRGKKGKSALKSKESESDKHSVESTAKIPVQRSICPIAASQSGRTIPTILIDHVMPADFPVQGSICPIAASQTGQTIPIDHVKPPEIPVQGSICPIAASQTGQTIPTDHVKPPEIPVQRSICPIAASQTGQTIQIDHVKSPEIPVQGSKCPIAASQTGQTIPIDQKLSIDPAASVDPEQTTGKKKRQKKSKSALKSRESESDKHNVESTAKIPVQRIHGFQVTTAPFKLPGESSVSKCNAEPPANTQNQSAKGLQVTKIKFKRHGESSTRCLSCHQSGHQFRNCPSRTEIPSSAEICFFCGEIGHTLGKCSVFKAGGGRFARCLFCHGHGHFTNKCPQNGHGIDSEVVAADGPIDKSIVDMMEGCS